MSAHTPGPWVVEPILDRFNVYLHGESCVCIARDCTEHDARLLAAAPDLLQAGVDAEELLRLICEVVCLGNPPPQSIERIAALRAAIRKATAA